MSTGFHAKELEAALRALGELLAAADEPAAVVVVGGATLNLLGVVRRATNDVDVIARVSRMRMERSGWNAPSPSRRVWPSGSGRWRGTSA